MSLKDLTKAINLRLDALVAQENVAYNRLFQAARYSLLSAGKRLRPLITLSILKDFGFALEKGLDAACAIELIHTYSLIHDDLPSIDNDDTRRNQPSLHKAYDEGLALLAGDFLLTLAFEVLTQVNSLSDNIRLKLIGCLAQKAGAKGMIGGQVLDIFYKNRPCSDNTTCINLIHKGKTGALFDVAFLFGGIIAQISAEDLHNLTLISALFGKAFQYMDDFEDFYKKKHETVNIVTSIGVENTLNQIHVIQSNIFDLLGKISQPLLLLSELIEENFSNFFNLTTYLVK